MRARIEALEIPKSATNTARWLKDLWGEIEASLRELDQPPETVDCHLMMTARQLGELVSRVDFIGKIDELAALREEFAADWLEREGDAGA
jgi:hypothetical protein